MHVKLESCNVGKDHSIRYICKPNHYNIIIFINLQSEDIILPFSAVQHNVKK